MTREEYLSYFLEEWNYPQDAKVCFKEAYQKLRASSSAPVFEEKLQHYETHDQWDLKAYLSDQEVLSKGAGVHRFTLDFLLLALMTEHLCKVTLRNGITKEVFHKTVEDLFYKNDECWCVYGIWGTFVASWCIEMYDGSRVGLGRLQFELIPFGRSCEKDGFLLKEDDQVINVHIPRDKTRLSKERIDDAFSRAIEYFRPAFRDRPVVFYCHSWLLYPENLTFLPEKSNLRIFSSYFEIIWSEAYQDWRECAWRLFDTLEANPTKLPEDSSLRRAFKSHLVSGGRIGEGIGIRIIK